MVTAVSSSGGSENVRMVAVLSSVARWLQRSLGGSQLMNSGTCDMTAMAVSELTGWDAFAAACDGDRKQGLERADLRTKTAPEKGAFRGTTNVRHQRF